MTMQAIGFVELTAAQAAIEFTSIPQDGTDLYVLVSAREATTNNLAIQITFNGLSTNRSSRFLFGTGSSASSASNSELVMYVAAQVRTANTFGNGSIYIPNYASTTTAKSVSIDAVEEDNGTSAYQMINAGLWNSTAAITTLRLAPSGGNFAAGSTATLYKITRGSDGVTTVS